MSDPITSLDFEFEGLGTIVATPSKTEKDNTYFEGSPSENGKRVLVDLSDLSDDPMAALNSLPKPSVLGVKLEAKAPAHLSQPRKRKDGSVIPGSGGNPTITFSGSTKALGGNGHLLMVTVTFLKATEKRSAGYSIVGKAIPQGEPRSRPARGSHKGFATVG